MTTTTLGTQPPDDYCPGRKDWTEDQEDVFYVRPELRAAYCDPGAAPIRNDLRKLFEGQIRLQRIVRGPKGRYVTAPDIVNTGVLAQLRPTSVDRVTVTYDDELHVAAWKHTLRLRFAENMLRTDEQARQMEAARPRCRICGQGLTTSAPAYRPWSKGAAFCSQCAEAVNLAGAQRHLDQHREDISRWLD